jgi:hypothetical protein
VLSTSLLNILFRDGVEYKEEIFPLDLMMPKKKENSEVSFVTKVIKFLDK